MYDLCKNRIVGACKTWDTCIICDMCNKCDIYDMCKSLQEGSIFDMIDNWIIDDICNWKLDYMYMPEMAKALH